MEIRELFTKKSHRTHFLRLLVVLAVVGLAVFLKPQHAAANNFTYVTVHYDGSSQTLATDAPTIGEFLKRAEIPLHEKDMVEPSKDTALIASDYNVNVYRARPVTVVDGANRYSVVTAAQTAKQMAEAASIAVHAEDKLTVSRIDDFISEGVGMKVEIARATPLNFVLYGTSTEARTQLGTVAEFLAEKGISLKEGDQVSPDAQTAITAGMTISVTHNGKQLATVEEDIDFPIESIRDADREVGYREVKEAGQKGRKLVTYEVHVENGKEISRKALNSVVKTEPKKQIEIIGAKAKVNGDFATALSKLRSCEGSYTSVNPIGYYGAYQFGLSTWKGSAPAGWENTRPDQAPPEVQDQAAANLYKKRGWQPWPACSKKLGLQDVYR